MKKNYKFRIKTELIEEYMIENNLNRITFCEKSKVSLDTLEKMYINDFDFDIVYLFRVCKLLNIEFKDIFDESE